MRFAGRMEPGRGAGIFTGQRPETAALSRSMGLSAGPAGAAGAGDAAFFFADVALAFFPFEAFFADFGALVEDTADAESRPEAAPWPESGAAVRRTAASAGRSARIGIGTAGGI